MSRPRWAQMPDADLAWRVEATCFNAFPSLKQAILAGWLLRFSEGLSRRANSANPLQPDHASPEAVIEAVEAIYRRQGLPAIVRVPSFLTAIEARLMARGYTSEGESCVLYGEMNGVTAVVDPSVELSPHASTEWLAAMAALQGHNAAHRQTYRRIVRAIAVPAAFAGLRIDGRLAALAYGAVSDSLLCYESVITDSRRRRHGLARRVIGIRAACPRGQAARRAAPPVRATER